jgi:oligopeptide/dipeptide ABC transporter ATP-binding protein
LAVVLITHDMGVVARLSDRVMVVYAGNIVEQGATDEVLLSPSHPYTQGLLASMPDITSPLGTLVPVQGYPPDGRQARKGCMFAPRCHQAQPICHEQTPRLTPPAGSHGQACHFPLHQAAQVAS